MTTAKASSSATIAVDNKYLFTLKDEVVNKGAAPVTLYPYALISRHGIPPTLGYYILHEGLIWGVSATRACRKKPTPRWRRRSRRTSTSSTRGWASPTNIGPPRSSPTSQPRFVRASPSSSPRHRKKFQTDYLLDPQTIAPGATGTASARLFAGAKEVEVIETTRAGVPNRFELVIDWGVRRSRSRCSCC